MKLLGIVLFVLAVPQAFAVDTYHDMDTEKTIEIYATITSGWLLNKSCNILTEAEASELKRNRDLVTKSLKLRLQPEFFPAVEKSARSVVSEQPFSSCGDLANDAVRGAEMFAREWAGEISGLKPLPPETAPVLPVPVQAKVAAIKSDADKLMAQKQYSEAIGAYWRAYDLLPQPVQNWAEAPTLLVSVAEANFRVGNYEACRDNLSVAMKSLGVIGNPIVHLRLGACQFELGDMLHAADELARAYIPAGTRIFQAHDQKYLVFIKTKLTPPPAGWPNGW